MSNRTTRPPPPPLPPRNPRPLSVASPGPPPSVPPRPLSWNSQPAGSTSSPAPLPYTPPSHAPSPSPAPARDWDIQSQHAATYPPPPRPPKVPPLPARTYANGSPANLPPHHASVMMNDRPSPPMQEIPKTQLRYPPPPPGPPPVSSIVHGQGNDLENLSPIPLASTPVHYGQSPFQHQRPDARDQRLPPSQNVPRRDTGLSIFESGTPVDQQLPGHVLYFPPLPASSSRPQSVQGGLESSFQSLSLGAQARQTATSPETQSTKPGYYAASEPEPPRPASSRMDSGSRKKPPAITTCIDFESPMSATWYWHPSTPDFLVCEKCYSDEIQDTQFAGSFQSAWYEDDGTRRVCRFSLPAMKDHLWGLAVVSGSLDEVIAWMRSRCTIPACKGMDGVKGGEGRKWYQPRPGRQEDNIPGFMVCQACLGGHILVSPSFSSRFELMPEDILAKDDIWLCDYAMPFVKRQFKEKSKNNDWRGFAAEVTARMRFPRCPGLKPAPTYQVAWFVPKAGPSSLMFCTACYCDQVLGTGEEVKWREATEMKSLPGHQVRCAMAQINVQICMARAEEIKNYSRFWNAVYKLANSTRPQSANEPQLFQQDLCKNQGQNDGEWYTLRSDPDEFAVCKACHILMVEPLGLGRFFQRKQGTPTGEVLLCCFNTAHPRMPGFFMRFLEGYVKQETSSLESFASVWAKIAPCKRDEDIENMHWYGWEDCTICRECYHGFASRFPRMVQTMQLHDQKIGSSVMCEMYSPRMRKLYEQVATSGEPLDLRPLLEYSLQRRQVYMETVPQIRMAIMQQEFDLEQQQMLNTLSSYHLVAGSLEQINHGSGPYTYSAAGVGHGFANMDLLKAADYQQQAMGIVGGGSSAVLEVSMLEQRWRAVE